MNKCFFLNLKKNLAQIGGGATRPLPRDRGVEELHGDPTFGPRPKFWTRCQKWKK